MNEPTSSTSQQSAYHHLYKKNIGIFGESTDLSLERLPTLADILKYYFFLFEHPCEDKKVNSYKDVTSNVIDKVVQIWQKLPMEIMSKKTIFSKLNRFIDTYQKMTRHPESAGFNNFVQNLPNLFNISTCYCDIINSNCTCNKTPLFLKAFLIDQRTHRNQTITTFLQTLPEPSTSATINIPQSISDMTYNPCQEISDVEMDESDFVPPVYKRKVYAEQRDLPNIALECDRYGISNRVAASLVSATLKDFSVKDKNDAAIIVDKNKIQRERYKCREAVLRKRLDTSSLLAFSFDSRKDDTLSIQTIQNRPHPRIIKEPHLVVLREPNSTYIGYIILQGHTADIKKQQLIDFFEQNNIPLDSLIAICCDGEVTNTGIAGGIIRKFEEHLNKELHWAVCLLHFNELPFRHLYDTIESSTTKGPRTTTGALAAKLEICETLKVWNDILCLLC